jgi:hypothetical protein
MAGKKSKKLKGGKKIARATTTKVVYHKGGEPGA